MRGGFLFRVAAIIQAQHLAVAFVGVDQREYQVGGDADIAQQVIAFEQVSGVVIERCLIHMGVELNRCN